MALKNKRQFFSAATEFPNLGCIYYHHSNRRGTDLAVVVLLSFVGENRADDDACVLDNHFSGFDVPLAEKAAAVDGGPAKVEPVSSNCRELGDCGEVPSLLQPQQIAATHVARFYIPVDKNHLL